jgi:hypothetical protein
MLCRDCGHDNPPGYRFCGLCGRPPVIAAVPGSGTGYGPAWIAPPPARYPRPAEDTLAGAHRGRPADRSGSPVTRYLCAAVTMLPGLARQVIEDMLEEEHRAVVTTPGADLGTIAKYALAAEHRRAVRDAVLATVLCLGLVAAFLAPLELIPVLLLAAWVTVFAERWAGRYGAAVRGLQPGAFLPERVRGPARNSRAYQQLQRVASASTDGNVTVYGGFPPFIGYGRIQASWSFAIDVTRPRRIAAPRFFSVQQVYNQVKAGLLELDAPGMQITEQLFVNGRDIDDDRRFLIEAGQPPVTSVPPELMRDLIARPEERARPYLTVTQASWDGDLVTTSFVRFVLSRSDLVVEVVHTVVPPLRAEFKAIDERELRPTAGELLGLVRSTAIGTVPRLLGSVPGVLHVLTAEARRDRKRSGAARIRDYGPLLSIREAAADSQWQRYFQKLDAARQVHVVEQRMLRSLQEFLDAHEIDTASLVSRADTLLGNRVMVTDQAAITERQATGARPRTAGVTGRGRGHEAGQVAAGGGWA